MRHSLIVLFISFTIPLFGQNVELIDTLGNKYVGTIYSESKNSLCIETKNNQVLCFDSLQLLSYENYETSSRTLPLSKEFNPISFSHDFGILIRSNIAGSGALYSFTLQKRLNDHYAFGIRSSMGLGDFLEFNFGAISTYQFNQSVKHVNTISFSIGALKELIYWSEQGFDINLEYALLMRKERNKSRRLFFSTGFYSAKYSWCNAIGCNPYYHRSNELQAKFGYGWQF